MGGNSLPLGRPKKYSNLGGLFLRVVVLLALGFALELPPCRGT